MSDEHASPESEVNEIENALGSLVPARGRIDRDRIMFRAGQASSRPPSNGRRAWMAIAASLALVASGEGLLLARRPSTEFVERIIVVREPANPSVVPSSDRVANLEPAPAPGQPEPYPSLDGTAHERLAGQVLRYGLDGLPRSASAAWGDPEPRAISSRQQLQEELRQTLNPGDPT